MLQAMLEDRFALKMHRETKEKSIYSLVVARRGSKIKPWVDGSCVIPVPGKPQESGTIAWGYRPELGTLDSQNVLALADFLSSIMGGPVVDTMFRTRNLPLPPPESTPQFQKIFRWQGLIVIAWRS